MVCFIGRYHVLAGLLALAAYLTVGVVLPMWNGKRGSQKGMEFRTGFGELNSFVLDSLRGLDETIQYGQGEKRKEQMSERSKELASVQENLSRMEGSQRSVTNMVILLASFGMLALTIYLYTKGGIGFEGVLTCTIAMMGSFGPVVALSSLSNNLNQTLASGERVLSLLEEAPLVEEIPGDAASGGDHDLKTSDALLGCPDGARFRGRSRCPQNPDKASARYGKLCDAGDTSVPRFDCEQHRYCKTRRDAGRNYGGGEEGVHT